MAQFNYMATAQDGSIHTRKSNRVYTHAVVGTWNDGRGYGVMGWSSRLDLAQKVLATWNKIADRLHMDGDFTIVEVESVDAKVKGVKNPDLVTIPHQTKLDAQARFEARMAAA